MTNLILLFSLLFILNSQLAAATLPVLGIRDGLFTRDGEPFQMWGVRTASASQSDELADQLIANLDIYHAHGINAVTVFYMGSLGGSSDPFSPDGRSIDLAHQARMERIIRACGERGMFVVVGIFYQNVKRPNLRDWDATKEAVRTVAAGLRPFPNVIINPANEQGAEGYEQLPWAKVRVPESLLELCRLIKAADPQRLVGAGGYDGANNKIIGLSPHTDALLYDHNKPEPTPAELFARYRAAGITKPIVNVELFGAWTREHRPAGVYPEAAKQKHYRAIDEALRTPGHHLFFHSSPWLQASTEPDAKIRFDLGGKGTAEDRGIRWYFEHLQTKLKP